MQGLAQRRPEAGHQHIGDVAEVGRTRAKHLLPVGAHAPQHNRQRVTDRDNDRRDDNTFGKVLFRLIGLIH